MFGGFSNQQNGNMIKFEPSTNTWSDVKYTTFDQNQSSNFHKQFPKPRFYHTMNQLFNKLVIFGGGGDYIKRLKARESFNDIWFYDTLSCVWTNPGQSSTFSLEYAPKPRMYHSSSIYNKGKGVKF